MRERLYRSRTDRMLLGVAGGMADWLDLDPSLVRLVWALLMIAGGVGLLLYVVAAIVIPEEPVGQAAPAAAGTASAADAGGAAPVAGEGPADDWHARRAARRAARAQGNGNGAMIFGLVLIGVGVWFLVGRFVRIDTEILVPGVLIVLGGALVVGALARSGNR